jgi:hypothetical protein
MAKVFQKARAASCRCLSKIADGSKFWTVFRTIPSNSGRGILPCAMSRMISHPYAPPHRLTSKVPSCASMTSEVDPGFGTRGVVEAGAVPSC